MAAKKRYWPDTRSLISLKMSKQEINIELLLGKSVFSANGRPIGRLEEVQAELRMGRCFVTEFHIGSYALLERFAAMRIGGAILRTFHAKEKRGGYRVAWDQLDLSDPARPRLLCAVSALPPLNPGDSGSQTAG
jgi:sporulation protein YlmC with PRC-barrel domain